MEFDKLQKSPLCSHDTQLSTIIISNVMVVYPIIFEFATSTKLIHIVTCKQINFAKDLTFFFYFIIILSHGDNLIVGMPHMMYTLSISQLCKSNMNDDMRLMI
jgi:hypothetical protein